ncbi:hypothetical protein I2494_19555 [Budviciaceae bacterium BWR-B9]|uniref:Nucleotide modification associated domain-containing protein n=1 Tax=Limnobaculum allomyrinae TaxID=2791986 RepID=A0ABS1IVT0_9GAMM|nr:MULTISPECIES: Nmad5 family putative nucleotide modification protein [Limnobaculum]MBK5145868.1 hypothetical protein [Limnobaculum allomyrinae]MBV7693879.1 hypothetical protein [Limnobaculum sp. M2-1]
MAYTTLTRALKNAIIDNAVIKAGIPRRKAKLRAARADWAERVRVEALGGVQVEPDIMQQIAVINAKIKLLPRGLLSGYAFVNKRECIYLNLAGQTLNAYFNGNYKGYENPHECVLKITLQEYTLTADNPLVDEFYAFDPEYKAIHDHEKTIRMNVEATLCQVRTVKRLIEEWPEAVELLPKEEAKAMDLPAIRRETLNELVGLPSETT